MKAASPGRWPGCGTTTATTTPRSIRRRNIASRRPRLRAAIKSRRFLSHQTLESIMKLYGFPPSPNTWKVRAAAAHIGVPLDVEFVDLTKGAQRSPAYLALNPSGRTPTLVDGDFTLWESDAILQYVGSKKPNALWPDDVRKRADITHWMCWQLAHFGGGACQPLTFQRLVKKILNLGPPDAAAVAAALDAFDRYASLLEAH